MRRLFSRGEERNLTHYHPAMPFGNRKFRGTFQFRNGIQFKKYQPFGDLKFNNLDISLNLKLRFFMGKIL